MAPDETKVSGELKLGVEFSIEGAIEKVEVGLKGGTPAAFDQVLPTLKLDTTTFPNGDATLVLRVTDDLGNEYSDSLALTIENPDHRFLGYESPNTINVRGDTIELELEYSKGGLDVAADFSALDTEFRSSSVDVSEDGGGRFTVLYPISPENVRQDGTYPVELVASNAAGAALRSTIWLQYRVAPSLPLSVPGALFSDRSGIQAHVVPSGAPGVAAISGPTRILSGQPEVLNVSLTEAPEHPARYLAVQAEGYSGSYILPVTSTDVTLPLELPPMAAGTELDDMTLLVHALDDTGATLGSTSYQIQPVPAPTGPVQVLLTWNAPVDLDLEVVTPAGNTISYSTPAADGGRLLLDSNAMCQIDGLNAELISWPLGQERSGTYSVRASLYDMCGQDTVDYTVLVKSTGEDQTFIGSFSQADFDAGAFTQEAGSFAVDGAYHVDGRVTFESSSPGLASVASAIGIPVQVLDSERHVVASTRTDHDGNYFIPLSPPPESPFTVVARASWDVPGGPDWSVRVLPHTGSTEYSWESQPIAVGSGGVHVEDIHITEDNNSGALNILEFMRQARQWMIAQGLVPVTPLVARWENLRPSPFGAAVACSPRMQGCNNEWAVYYTGTPLEFGAFDPSVLEHEFGHHLIYSLSRHGNGGGGHSWGSRIRASFAWDEGIATALGQDLLGHSLYQDRGVNSDGYAFTFEINLDTGPGTDNVSAPVARGTTGPINELSGDMSELVPAMVVWDLLDPATAAGAALDAHDTLGEGRRPAFDALFRNLPETSWQDRGADGVDLEDFLDQWFCNDSVGRDATAQGMRAAAVEAILMDRWLYYDFAWNAQCR